MRRAFWVGAAAVAALALAGAATAQSGKPSRIKPDRLLGDWSFRTDPYDGGGGDCVMTGRMKIKAGERRGLYTCTFSATETCKPGRAVTAEQTCTGELVGNQLTLKATIISVSPPSAYAPDDWELTVQSPTRMVGELRSADIAPVTFFRTVEAIS
jgi:hypothetical protein